jgi:hypothetical protein
MTFTLTLVMSTILATQGPPAAGRPSDSPPDRAPALRVNSGRWFIDDRLVLGPFSIHHSPFRYIYLYVPGRGLYTIGSEVFEGADRAGEFRGRTLRFSVGGSELRLESRTPILGGAAREAWVRHEPDLTLDVHEVVYGYGDYPTIADHWRDRLGRPLQ